MTIGDCTYCGFMFAIPLAVKAVPLTDVPLELSVSCTTQSLPCHQSCACFSETALSLIQILLARVLPTDSLSTPGLVYSVLLLGPAVAFSRSSIGTGPAAVHSSCTSVSAGQTKFCRWDRKLRADVFVVPGRMLTAHFPCLCPYGEQLKVD